MKNKLESIPRQPDVDEKMNEKSKPEKEENDFPGKERKALLEKFRESKQVKMISLLTLISVFSGLGGDFKKSKAWAGDVDNKQSGQKLSNRKDLQSRKDQKIINIIENSKKETLPDNTEKETFSGWRREILEMTNQSPEAISKIKNLLKEIWGDDFSSDVEYQTSEDLGSKYGFTPGGLYTLEDDTIKFNSDFISNVDTPEEIDRFLDLLFHESGHADFSIDHSGFLKEEAEKIGVTDGNLYSIIKNSKLLPEEKQGVVLNSSYCNKIINEIYAAISEVNGTLKMHNFFENFPTSEFLAQSSFFNKISDFDQEQQLSHFEDSGLNISTYSAVEFLSILIMEKYEYDMKKIRQHFKQTDPQELAGEIAALFQKFQSEKISSYKSKLDNHSPADVYEDIEKEENSQFLQEEEIAVRKSFQTWSENIAKAHSLENDHLLKRIQEMKEGEAFRKIALHTSDEVNYLREYSNQNLENQISKKGLALIEAVKDSYLSFMKQEETLDKTNETIAKSVNNLNKLLKGSHNQEEKERIKKEINNLYQIRDSLFGLMGGFEKRS